MVNVESISSLISSGVDSAAQMSIGQAILKAIDKVLWTIEKSVQWSLPSTDVRMEVNGKPSSEVDFVRPLPWILFLPTLIFLRVVRISINLTASVLGYPKVEPIDMIQVLQKSRKRIQAIKSTGMKNMKLNKGSTTKDEPMTVREASKSLAKSLRLTLSTLSCLDSGTKMPPSPPPTKIRVSNFFDSVSSEAEEKPEVEVTSSAVNDSKRKFSDMCSDDSVDETDESDDEAVLDDELNGVAVLPKAEEKVDIEVTSTAEINNKSNNLSDISSENSMEESDDSGEEHLDKNHKVTNINFPCGREIEFYNLERGAGGAEG
ncbi:uncharacterized protein LOC106655168 isoform X1 [Trichogramma pretiosum]|uniref:uncharacterized protein LOC106655168 isoform X1 n=1 Tax=Trichogramma pretiosum TaxID=7493 RepID=UPI0006C98A93|nr:uncharacterized protein LOC106655168 isoform X1 [Trichogramma pretiosum]XP_014230877.1 uncharacterized protein LOC106655168 isoform X1 [Trichogramma pretiosum]XP_014230878.1 uncharacterized protein LOC106655168 isoform X1 [Trichogramma pretiosum]